MISCNYEDIKSELFILPAI